MRYQGSFGSPDAFAAAPTVGLDSGVPGVAAFGGGGAEGLTEVLHGIGGGDAREELDALVAKLARGTQAKRTAEADGKVAVIHAPRDERAWVLGFGEIETVPPVGLDGEVGEEAG